MDPDSKVVDAAVSSLIGQIPGLSPLRARVGGPTLTRRGRPQNPTFSGDHCRRDSIVGSSAGIRAEAVLWDHVLPPRSVEVRAAALGALGKWATSATKDHLQRLFRCSGDADFRVAAPALMLLQRLPVDAKSQSAWVQLLQAPDVAARKLAMEKVGDRDNADVLQALLAQLSYSDPTLREAALQRLSSSKKGREALTNALLQAKHADRAWELARAQAPFAKEYPPAWRDEVFEQTAKHIDAGDRRADAFLFLLRDTNATDLRDRLEERAVALRKKKAYPGAFQYLRLLARDPALGFETRFELATCGLKVSAKDLAHEARAADPCLAQFSNLIQQNSDEVVNRLTNTKWLDAEDLYYLGFHFAEQEGMAKKFAGEVLKLVVKRAGRSKLAQAAKSKIRGAGLQ